MKAKANTRILHDELGQIEEGQEFEATVEQLSGIRDFVTVYETKVIHQTPQKRKG